MFICQEKGRAKREINKLTVFFPNLEPLCAQLPFFGVFAFSPTFRRLDFFLANSPVPRLHYLP